MPGSSGTVIPNDRLMGVGSNDIRIRVSGALVGRGSDLVGVIQDVEYSRGR